MRETLTEPLGFKDYLSASADNTIGRSIILNVKSYPGGECGQEPEDA